MSSHALAVSTWSLRIILTDNNSAEQLGAASHGRDDCCSSSAMSCHLAGVRLTNVNVVIVSNFHMASRSQVSDYVSSYTLSHQEKGECWQHVGVVASESAAGTHNSTALTRTVQKISKTPELPPNYYFNSVSRAYSSKASSKSPQRQP